MRRYCEPNDRKKCKASKDVLKLYHDPEGRFFVCMQWEGPYHMDTLGFSEWS